MRRSGKKPPLALLRGLLMVILITVVGGLAVLFFIGRASRPSPPPPAPETTAIASSDLLRGEGFEHEVTHEGKKIFVIKADRIASDEVDHFRLEGVELIFSREDGNQYTIQSDWSTYDRNTDGAVLEGNVIVHGPNELTLETDGLELKRQGNLVASTAPVRISLTDYAGEADRITVNLRRDEFSLVGKVKLRHLVESVDQMTLECQRLSFERAKHLIRAEGSVLIRTAGKSSLAARRLSILMSDDEKSPRFLRARWGLSGSFQQPATNEAWQVVDFEGTDLSVTFEELEGSPKKIELEGTRRRPAKLKVGDASGANRVIQSRYLVGEISKGSIRSVQLVNDVVLEERTRENGALVTRKASGQNGVAHFGPEKTLSRFLLDNDVKLEEPQLTASGQHLEIDLTNGQSVITGNPVRLISERGQIEAPRLVHSHGSEELHALEGVRVILEQTGELALLGAAGKGEAINIESEEAEWNDKAAEFRFLIGVKAWQGDSFLLADEMVAQIEADQLSANGSVRTVWRPQPRSSTAGARESPAPVEVNAENLVYSRSRQLLTYSGNAQLRQEGRLLSCDTMNVFTTEDDGIQRLDCEGQARLEDSASGNTLEGTTIAYLPEEQQARVVGDPVLLRDQQGTLIEGRQLLYDLQKGTAQLESRSISTSTDSESPEPVN